MFAIQDYFISIIFLIVLYVISIYKLVYIKKTFYPNLWEKDKQKTSLFSFPERQLMYELSWKTPYWVRQNREARIWIYVFRFAPLIAFLIIASPIIYAFVLSFY